MGRAVYRYLLNQSTRSESLDRLQSYLRPLTLAGDEEGGSGQDVLTITITGFETLGMFAISGTGDQRVVSLDSRLEPSESESRRADQTFSRTLRRLVVEGAGSATDLWEQGDEGKPSNAGSRDLLRALTWLLAQDIQTVPGRWVGEGGKALLEQVEGRQLRADARPIFNSTRWDVVARWAPALGLAWHNRHGEAKTAGWLVPDPTAALRQEVPTIFEQDDGLPIAEFVGRLARRLPFLDEGVWRVGLTARFVPEENPLSPDPGLLSPVLSHALARLHDEEVIALIPRDDARERRRLHRGSDPAIEYAYVGRGKDGDG